MSIHPHTIEQTGVMLDHPNVRLSPKFEKVEQSKRKVNSYLHNAIFPLVLSKPNWIFTVADSVNGNGYCVATVIDITESGEALGKISIEYHRSGYKIVVYNERIDAKRERGRGYKTESPEKAMLAIRKHFYRLGTSERIDKVREEADHVITQAKRNASWEATRKRSHLMQHAEEFTAAHMEEYLSEFPTRAQAKEEYDEAHNIDMIVDSVKGLFDKREALVVVLDGEHYIVVQGKGEPQMFTSESLPYHMREKIGLLKLVEDHQMIKDVGCRIKADAFVITPE